MNTLLYHTVSDEYRWGQLSGSSLSLVLAEYCQNTPGVKLVLAQDNLSAVQIQKELPFFLNEEKPAQELLFFPDWETLPYDLFSPHQDIISERLYTLSRMQQSTQAIVITSISTLMHRLCPPSFLNQYALMLKKGQKLELHPFRNQLQQSGYYCVNKVLEHGEFAIRGSIIDLYPMGSNLPFRVELFDDEIESLRRFDTETQRTIEQINEIQILPAREFPLNEASQSVFRKAFRELCSGNPSQCPIYEAVSKGQYPAGIEYFLPLFFEKTASFFDYLPPTAKICYVEDLHTPAELFWQELTKRYEQRRHNVSRPILPPETSFIKPNELFAQANNYKPLHLYHEPLEKKGALNFNIGTAPQLTIDRKHKEPLHLLKDYCTQSPARYLIIVESAGRREVLLELLKPSGLSLKIQASWSDFLKDDAPLSIIIGPLVSGAELQDKKIVLIVEAQLFGEQSTPLRKSTQKTIDPDLVIRDMAELSIGAPVVHLQFGVGRYQGLQYLNVNDIASEFLVLVYAGEDKIYVPITSLHLISRYTGVDSEHAPLHQLGSGQWQKEKKKAAEKIHDVAIELLDLYAKREAQPGHQYRFHQSEYAQFVSSFPFTETSDQLKVIEEVIQDMQASKPMDRLICGDVGFGKTEVAMRAAFVAVQNNKQVCVLVPTTLLAGQHFETFRDRFADFPVNIELLSRFRSAKESAQVLEGLSKGTVDIVIGTHKLFQSKVLFKNLGLLIIDEEHRFGVKQKEYIKALRTHVDLLSMTATPIPRTLNMAMAGIRDISLITTPPEKRLAIKTFWQEKNDYVIREAILRELLRGGQVFFLHNNVQSIYKISEDLQRLIPEAKICSAHGQMPERALERVMSDFYHHRFNVLVCTTIIETGIDIPTANTIIIDRADQFGLAQLHQLRGRVGRSHHQAYAYLLTPDEQLLKTDALKRLKALVSFEDLGSGFILATHDLEIRGAGELLGEDQSGNMQAIGFNLFMELLDKAVHDLKEGKTPELSAPMHTGPDIDLGISALIPEHYINDIHNRLIFYKRIAHAKSKAQLDDLHAELVDRFGLLPPQVKHLLLVTELKLKAEQLGLQKISAQGEKASLDFKEQPKIKPEVLIRLIQVHAQRYKMDGPQRLRFKLDGQTPEDRIAEISALLNQLSGI